MISLLWPCQNAEIITSKKELFWLSLALWDPFSKRLNVSIHNLFPGFP